MVLIGFVDCQNMLKSADTKSLYQNETALIREEFYSLALLIPRKIDGDRQGTGGLNI